jgi:hypothetical protein
LTELAEANSRRTSNPWEKGRWLLFAENDFAVTYQLVVEPETILEGGGFDPGPSGATEQAHTGGSLKHVGRKRATVHIELDTKIAGVRDPGNLVAVIENDSLGNQAYEYGPFSHFFGDPLKVFGRWSGAETGWKRRRRRARNDNTFK